MLIIIILLLGCLLLAGNLLLFFLTYYRQNIFELESFVLADQESLRAWVESTDEAFSQQNLNDSLAQVGIQCLNRDLKGCIGWDHF